MGLIYTKEASPESKGKVEKGFDYLQRRTPYLCERHKIRTIPDAQQLLLEEIQLYNEQRTHEGPKKSRSGDGKPLFRRASGISGLYPKRTWI